MQESEYRKNLVEIIDGSSTVFLHKKRVFIKHKALSDIVDYELIYNHHFDNARKRGMPTEENILKELHLGEIWTEEEENNLATQKSYIESLKKNKVNIFLESAIARVDEQIEQAQADLNQAIQKRARLISNSAESYATNRANDFYIVNSFYSDREQTKILFTEEEYDYLEKDKLSEIINVYSDFNQRFSEESIQNLVLQDFYKIYYPLSESCSDFFGKAALKLTNLQLNLLIYTRVFKNIFDNFENIPERMHKNPKALLDFASSSKAREAATQKLKHDDSAGGSIVGATKQDLESLGVGDAQGSVDLHKEAMKKGGSLSMQDLMKLNGL